MQAIKLAILARLPWVNFWVAQIVINLFRLVPGYYKRPSATTKKTCCVAIEAGAQGWNSIEFKEIYGSAIEYFKGNSVKKIVIDKSMSYVSQVEKILSSSDITHYLYDPRTGRQNFWSAFYESFCIAILFSRYRVVPVVYLTDLSVRLWRCQAAAVSANNGVVITLMMPKLVQPIFPHRRLVGPSLMPFSGQTLNNLKQLRYQLALSKSIQPVVRFAGSFYEPRTTFLRRFKEKLDATGHNVEILGRELGSQRVTDDEYWVRIGSAEIVITTADQALQTGTDWAWVPHLVFRYLEVLASGSLLLAPPVPGVSRYFESGVHFVSFDSLEDAVDKARFYLDNSQEADKIRKAGHEKAEQLIRSHIFWLQIEAALGSDSFFV